MFRIFKSIIILLFFLHILNVSYLLADSTVESIDYTILVPNIITDDNLNLNEELINIAPKGENATYVNNTTLRDQTKTYSKLTIKGGSINSTVQLRYIDSIIKFDLDGFVFLEYGTLSIDNSTFNLTGNITDSHVLVGPIGNINVDNESYVTINEIRNYGQETTANDFANRSNFHLNISNSIVSINTIYFKPQGSGGSDISTDIVSVSVTNDLTKKDDHSTTINGINRIDRHGVNRKIGIQAHSINISLENANLKINGDIVLNDYTGTSNFTLDNSNFEFGGNLIEKVDRITLSQGSLLTFGKADSFKSRVMELNSNFEFNSDASEARVGTLNMIAKPEISFYLTEESSFEAGNLVFAPNEGVESRFDDKMKIDINVSKSNFKIDDLDIRGYKGCNASAQSPTVCGSIQNVLDIAFVDLKNIITFGGAGNTGKIEVQNIFIDNEYVVLRWYQSSGPFLTIESINWEDNKDQLGDGLTDTFQFMDSLGAQDRVKIKNINMITASDNININLQNTQFQVTDTWTIDGDNNKDVTFTSYNSRVFVNDLICKSGCKNFTFQKPTNANTSSNTLIINIFDAKQKEGDDHSGNLFSVSNYNITVNDYFYYSGAMNIKSGELKIGHYYGELFGLNLIDTGKLTINKSSEIILKGDITLGNSSELYINANNVFVDTQNNPVDIYLDKKSKLEIDGENSINKIESTNESEVTLKNNVQVNEIYNDSTSILNLYQVSINNTLVNQNILNVFGQVHVDVFDNQSKEINFNISSQENYASLDVNEMNNTLVGDEITSKITFSNTSIFKPGHVNLFTIFHSDTGALGINMDSLDESLEILPPWLKEWHELQDNETGGQDLVVNVERLTDYSTLIRNIEDEQALNIANIIDKLVDDDMALQSDNLVNIVNSLDFNSGCEIGSDDEQWMYEVGQGNYEHLDDITCIPGLQRNFKSLKPIHTEVFLNYTHNNVSKNMNVLMDENRTYYGLNEFNFWVNDIANGTSLKSKGDVTGYSSFSNDFQVGITGSFTSNVNTTVMFGISSGDINSVSTYYDSNVNVLHLGASISYVSYYFYTTAAMILSNASFHNERHTKLLSNDYSENKNPTAVSVNNVAEAAFRFELGTEWSFSKVKVPEFILPNSTIDSLNIVPQAFVQIASMGSKGFKEEGSSASMTYDGFKAVVIDAGFGVDVYEEILLEEFLYVTNAFWTPKFTGNIKERYYSNPKSVAYFNDFVNDEYQILSNSRDNAYVGVELELKLSMGFTKNQYSFNVQYTFENGFGGYMGNSLTFNFKYALK